MWNTHNCFFQIGNKIFWLVTGITMGSDPILPCANLFIFYYESKWIKEIKRTDGKEWFADNFTALNNGGESGINTDKIRCKVANHLCL